jgi:hypothetical protein
VDATNATFYYVGYAMEILFYNSILTSSQIQQVEGYLARKWGISISATLPSPHPFRSFPPATLPFSPRNISGCLLWLDAADQSSMTLSGSSVTQWRDKSGRGFNVATSSGATAPLYNSSTKELQFVSGNSNSFTIPQAFGDALVGTTFSFFFIGRRTVNTTYVYFLSGATSGGNQNLFIGFLSNKMEIGEYGPYASADIPTFNSPDPMRLYYYDIQSSTTANLIMNGNALSTTVSGNLFLTSFAQPELGRRYGGAVYHDFNLSEMVVFSPALNTSQRQQVEGYLAHKWGLTPTYATNTPLSIPGCQLWLDGADTSSMTLSGSNVTQWSDKSGNGYHALPNAGGSAITVGTLNNLPAITFPAASTAAFLPSSSLSVGSGGYSVFFVANQTSFASGGTRIYAASGGGLQVFINNSPSPPILSVYTGSIMSSTFTMISNVPFLYSYTISSGGSGLWKNGVSAGTAGGSTSSISNFYIGNAHEPSSSFAFTGQMGEFLIYNSALTTSQRQTIEGYLARKWGLTVSGQFLSTHPFKSIPPA